jgi:heme-degrading monooxygenase HmoA
MIGVRVTFKYGHDFGRARVVSVAENARGMFEGMPGLRSKVFTVDEPRRRAMNFYIWESADAAKRFFSEEMRQRVTSLYGLEPEIARPRQRTTAFKISSSKAKTQQLLWRRLVPISGPARTT